MLTPHCEQFFGREDLIDETRKALNFRQHIVCLDGVGGVGKSALAIELVKDFYEKKEYELIISLSAKNKIWQGHSDSRRAGFSGITELLTEFAKIMGIEISQDTEELKSDIIEHMQCYKGLLLIDNLEEIDCDAVLNFLRDEVPSPIKVLVTSRVDRSLGARTISVPEMNQTEAKKLLEYELKRVEYPYTTKEKDEVDEILKATGRLPLALKWVASLAKQYRSLKSASQEIRRTDTKNKEFLDFCFSSMYDNLDTLAQEIATLCPYFGDEWGTLILSISLDCSEDEINEAIKKLEEKGILLANTKGDHSILQLTNNFLIEKLKNNPNLKDRVEENISKKILIKGEFISLPAKEKVRILYDRAAQEQDKDKMPTAIQLVKLAIEITRKEKKLQKRIPELLFLEGKIMFQLDSRREGLNQMKEALLGASEITKNTKSFDEEYIYLADKLLSYGKSIERKEALDMVASCYDKVKNVDKKLIEKFCKEAMKKEEYDLMHKFLGKIVTVDHAHWVINALWKFMESFETNYKLGESTILYLLDLASESIHASSSQKKDYYTFSESIKNRSKKDKT